jgi:hypothetical protein
VRAVGAGATVEDANNPKSSPAGGSDLDITTPAFGDEENDPKSIAVFATADASIGGNTDVPPLIAVELDPNAAVSSAESLKEAKEPKSSSVVAIPDRTTLGDEMDLN